MKYLLSILLVSCSIFLFSQSSRNIVGIGIESISYSSDDSDIPIRDGSYQAVFFEYDWISKVNLATGFEIHKSISGATDYLDGRVKVGYVFNGQSRVQIPVFGYLGYYRLKEQNGDTLGRIVAGLKGGVRFYVTDNLSVQGVYQIMGLEVSKIGDRTFQETVGNFSANGISLSAQYYFSKD